MWAFLTSDCAADPPRHLPSNLWARHDATLGLQGTLARPGGTAVPPGRTWPATRRHGRNTAERGHIPENVFDLVSLWTGCLPDGRRRVIRESREVPRRVADGSYLPAEKKGGVW